MNQTTINWLDDAEVETLEQKQQKARDSIKKSLTNAVQKHLDETAREKTYDHMLSLCTYATDPDPVLSAEGQAGVQWRSAVWKHCYQVLNDVLAEEREIPTEEELIAELPTFNWPTIAE